MIKAKLWSFCPRSLDHRSLYPTQRSTYPFLPNSPNPRYLGLYWWYQGNERCFGILSLRSIDWLYYHCQTSISCQSTQLNRPLQSEFDAQIDNPNIQNDKSNNKTTIRIASSSTIKPVYKHCSFSLRSNSQNTLLLNAAPSMLGWLMWYPKKRPRQAGKNMMGWLQCSCCIITARPPCGRPRKQTSRNAASSMMGWLHSDPSIHLANEQRRQWQVGTPSSTPTKNAALKTPVNDCAIMIGWLLLRCIPNQLHQQQQ